LQVRSPSVDPKLLRSLTCANFNSKPIYHIKFFNDIDGALVLAVALNNKQYVVNFFDVISLFVECFVTKMDTQKITKAVDNS